MVEYARVCQIFSYAGKILLLNQNQDVKNTTNNFYIRSHASP